MLGSLRHIASSIVVFMLVVTLSLAAACGDGCPVGTEPYGRVCKRIPPSDAGTSHSATGTEAVLMVADDGGATGDSRGTGRKGSGGRGSASASAAGGSDRSQQISSSGVTGQAASSAGGAGQPSDSRGSHAGPDSGAAGTASASAAGAACTGHAGTSICDQAVMYHCGLDGSSTSDTCMNVLDCQIGAATGKCGVCNPGSYHCVDSDLQVCSDSGVYEWKTTCESAVLCKEGASDCTAMACVPNEMTCSPDGSTLQTCRADGSGPE
jgi:hypothetical protein